MPLKRAARKRRNAKKDMDMISSLPSSIIENILCRVLIRDAVRTSILSRNWRYKWATIPKLVLDEYRMFDASNNNSQLDKPPIGRKQMTKECKFFYAVHQVLLLHDGPILEFTLSIHADDTCVEIDQIILHLLRKNTIKKLDFYGGSYKLPLSILSFHQLTDLCLSWCEFDFSPTFGGFGSLTSLSLFYVDISGETLLHLISTSPLLKRFSLKMEHEHPEKDCLILDLHELLKCLRVTVIEHLILSSWSFEFVATGELPTTLVHLKSLCMLKMMFCVEFRLRALFLLIKSSPNLEKIRLKQYSGGADIDDEVNSLEDYSDIWLEHLTEVEMQDFDMSKLDYEFVKLILAKSPVLKKLTILFSRWSTCQGQEVDILRILIRFPRVSPVAEIIVKVPQLRRRGRGKVGRKFLMAM